MIDAAYHVTYHEKPLMFIGAMSQEKLVSHHHHHHRAMSESDSCLPICSVGSKTGKIKMKKKTKNPSLC